MSEHVEHNYVKIWGILIVLLIISLIGPEFGIQWLTLVTAFGIAFVKAGLVIKYFMHLTVEKKIAQYILIACLAMMALMFFGIAPDVMNHEGQNWENVAAKQEIERALKANAAAGGAHGHEGGDHGHD